MSTNLMSGAQVVLECLTREKVEVIFGYPGGVTLPFYDAIYDSPIKHVLVRHEQNAGFAAQGYARSTGKVGVCCATSGPGATNLVTGLVDAMMDSIPIVAITGQVSSKLIGSDAFQEADTFGITRSGTKHNFLVKTLAELPQSDSRSVSHCLQRTPRAGTGRYHQGRVPGQRPLRAGELDSSAGLSRFTPKATPAKSGALRRPCGKPSAPWCMRAEASSPPARTMSCAN